MPMLPDAVIEVPNEDNAGTISHFRMVTSFMMFEVAMAFTSYLKYHALMIDIIRPASHVLM